VTYIVTNFWLHLLRIPIICALGTTLCDLKLCFFLLCLIFFNEENKSNETFKFQLGEHIILHIHLGQHVSFKSSIGLQR